MTSGTNPDILQRIMRYCAQTERCTTEVKSKLKSWNVLQDQVDVIIPILVREKFLDDVRFLKSYVAEKWNLDHWGKEKIRYGLELKGFEKIQIQKELDSIDQQQYAAGMHLTLTKKRNEIKSEDQNAQVKKILSFGLRRGFEEELIFQWLKSNGFDLDM